MARGIHLRQLRNTDLTSLGLEEGRVREPEQRPGQVRLMDVDPVMGRLILEARSELEEILDLLRSALDPRR